MATAATAVGDAGSDAAAALTAYAGTVAELQRQLEQLRGQADTLRQTLAATDPAAPLDGGAELGAAHIGFAVEEILQAYDAAQRTCAGAIRDAVPPAFGTVTQSFGSGCPSR